MSTDRLELALERLGAGDWKLFEMFASAFLVPEYPELRTMASTSGDGGRDAELRTPDDEPNVLVQYSVAQDWRAKINSTIRRINNTFPRTTDLIYVTSQQIGATADGLVRTVRVDKKIRLDIRDRSWFLERELTHPQRAQAADELAQRIVDPYLREKNIIKHIGIGLSDEESRIGLLHLSLDSLDRNQERNLTKSCFESLVMASLHDTDPDNKRLTIAQIIERVKRFLPATNREQTEQQIISALTRLSRRDGPVKHHNKTRDYCLSYPQRKEQAARQATLLKQDEYFLSRIVELLKSCNGFSEKKTNEVEEVARDIQTAVEEVLLERGEQFARAVSSGETHRLDVTDSVQRAASKHAGALSNLGTEELQVILTELLANPDVETMAYLRRIADGYTLFAFLQQTPDVQKVIVRLFTELELWLDTSMVLPLLAEVAIDSDSNRYYTHLIKNALASGIPVNITSGVVEEVERHLNRCLQFARTQTVDWKDNVPFVYAAYANSGKPRAAFASWVSQFRGEVNPIEDVEDYIQDILKIRLKDLTEAAESAETRVSQIVSEYWRDVHTRRRGGRDTFSDAFSIDRLVQHDVESSLGVIALRAREYGNDLGKRNWWITLDKTAFGMVEVLKSSLGVSAPSSPLLSADFLVEMLRVAPIRRTLAKRSSATIPILADLRTIDIAAKPLVELADAERARLDGQPEYLLRRNIRDELTKRRLRRGRLAKGGISLAETTIGANGRQSAAKRE